MGRTSCQLWPWLWSQHSPYSQEEWTRVSHQRANGGGGRTCHSIRIPYRKQNKTFMFPIDNRHPPPQFYLNIMFHILFCFQVTFQEKVIFFSPQYLIIPWNSPASTINHFQPDLKSPAIGFGLLMNEILSSATGTRHTQLSPVNENSVTKSTLVFTSLGAD